MIVFVYLLYETHQNPIRYVLCCLRCRKTHPKRLFLRTSRYHYRLESISAIIDKHYQKGLSASGEKPYDGLLLFKMLLIGMWNPTI
ncbi:hypothetical protein ACI76W_00100 [Capnocytophaga canimorsus]|uniref:hypothetical protein n=1 Tax=Capnocytophaga canimorsus TaxID=28188 RepID=UPI00385D6A00